MKKQFSIQRNSKRESLSIELVKNPGSYIENILETQLFSEIEELISDSWGEFSAEYLKKSTIDVYLVCLIRNETGELIALAPVKKLQVKGKTIYSLGLTAVHPKYRGLKLLDKMGMELAKAVILENILKGTFSIEVIFITPNIRTLSSILHFASFVYPNPYTTDKDGRIKESDTETWERIQEFLKITGEKYRKLEREGSIMEGFYDDKESLRFKGKIDHPNKIIDQFGERYLYCSPGREIVVRAKINLWGLIRAAIS